MKEIYSGVVSEAQIPVEVKIDTPTLFDSLQSTKQIDEKTTRHLIAWIKEQIEEGRVKEVDWVCSEDMIAEVFTKSNVKTDLILNVIQEGKLPI